MKLLLCKNIEKLGIVGDVVEVAAGYARNYLVPSGLATEPTDANMRKLAEARRHAEQEQIRARAELERLAEKIAGAEVTIRARANEEGVLYGSVGVREIVDALSEEGFYVEPDQVSLEHPLRHLDSVSVDITLADGLSSAIKVWVVREKTTEEGDESTEESMGDEAGREAGTDDDSTYNRE